jgi:integrase
MNRSSYGTGSIRLRADGRWEYRVYDREAKKQKTYRGATKAEAMAGPRRAHEVAVRAAQDAQDVTVADFLTGWLSARRPVVRASTWKRNASMLDCWVLPALGAKRLRDVTADDLHALYETAGKTLSPGSVRNVHAVVGLALEAAVREGKLPRNPARSVKAPRAGDRHWTVLTRTQANALLDAAKGDELEALWVLALTTGMRSGELLALRWSDIDLDDGYLNVERTVTQKAEGGLTTADPKTRAGRRHVPLIARAATALREHYTRSGAAHRRHTALVFPARNGGLMFSSNMLVQQFRPLLAKAGLPPMRFHDLRHSAATAMILDGAQPNEVSKRLGHASIAITLDLYAHTTQEGSDAITAAMEKRYGS